MQLTHNCQFHPDRTSTWFGQHLDHGPIPQEFFSPEQVSPSSSIEPIAPVHGWCQAISHPHHHGVPPIFHHTFEAGLGEFILRWGRGRVVSLSSSSSSTAPSLFLAYLGAIPLVLRGRGRVRSRKGVWEVEAGIRRHTFAGAAWPQLWRKARLPRRCTRWKRCRSTTPKTTVGWSSAGKCTTSPATSPNILVEPTSCWDPQVRRNGAVKRRMEGTNGVDREEIACETSKEADGWVETRIRCHGRLRRRRTQHVSTRGDGEVLHRKVQGEKKRSLAGDRIAGVAYETFRRMDCDRMTANADRSVPQYERATKWRSPSRKPPSWKKIKTKEVQLLGCFP